MKQTRTLPACVAIAMLATLLASCGGSGDDSSATGAAPTQAQAPAQEAPAATGPKKDQSSGATGAEGSNSTAAKPDRPASLRTDPASIPGAIVTSRGAVQTLPPRPAAQREAMDNSYASIREFGDETSGSQASDITFALVQYLTAKAAWDWPTACARLYSPLKDSLAKLAEKKPALEEGGCPAIYATLMKRGSKSESAAAARIDIASVRAEGDRAFVIYKTPDTMSADMPMYLDGGVWTVGALDAYVLTPELLQQNQGRE